MDINTFYYKRTAVLLSVISYARDLQRLVDSAIHCIYGSSAEKKQLYFN